MRYINISLIVSVLFLLASCIKDENLIINTFEDSSIPEELFYSEFEGIVVDGNDQVVMDALVYIGDEETKTDTLGLFKIGGFFNAQGTRIKVEKKGYWSTYGFVLPLLDTRAQLQVQLRNRENDTNFNSTEQETIKGNKYTVEFSADSFIDGNGKSYTGDVSSHINYINTTSKSSEDYFFGSFISSENRTFIASYGILEVELEGTSQEDLNIDKEAVISFEIPTQLVNNAPDEIALWSLNEENSLWIKEGIAKKEGDQYVGIVDHFSIWMIGEEFDLAKFSGKVIQNGTPYSNALITVVDGFSNRRFRTGTDGTFSFRTIINTAIDIMIEDACGETIYESTISIGNTDIDSNLNTASLNICEEEIESELMFTAFKDKENPDDPDEIDFIYNFENALLVVGEEMVDGEVHQFYEITAVDTNYDSGERPLFFYRWTEAPDGQINYGEDGIKPADVTNLPFWNIISLFRIDSTVEVTDGKYVSELSAGMTTHYADGNRDIIKLGKITFNVKVRK